MINKTFEDAHKLSALHRKALQKDDLCGCFYCLKTFPPAEIKDWIDEESTALCPYCGIDAVIGKTSGYPIDEDFLLKMNKYWFGG